MRHALLYDAVIFDLFGTLTQTISWANEEQAADGMADALGLPRDAFRQAWGATNVARDLGVYPHCEATLAHVCTLLGVVATPPQIAQACAIRFAALREALTPRDDAVETLYGLRQQGLRVGLISDASFDVVALWPETPFARSMDVVLFSCREGVKKPAPYLYRRACEQLDIPIARCLYVGDGGSKELSGAARVGMHAVLIHPSHALHGEVYRPGGEPWSGPAIARLSLLLSLVTGGSF
jgi:putative hydrolase of the HAD superfamily